MDRVPRKYLFVTNVDGFFVLNTIWVKMFVKDCGIYYFSHSYDGIGLIKKVPDDEDWFNTGQFDDIAAYFISPLQGLVVLHS
jgi:hypothetical protein